MQYLTTLYTDIGIKKKVNQDSALLMEADSAFGPILFAALCDGMGGLAKGEVASGKLTRALSKWFETDFPLALSVSGEGFAMREFRNEMNHLVSRIGDEIEEYSKRIGALCGTTITAVLIFQGRYYIVNVGDTRAYLFRDGGVQLTKDHTYVQMEVDAGRMTKEEAYNHPKRSILTQCVGASEIIRPDFFEGDVREGDLFVLCCDGFRHVLTMKEMEQLFTDENTRDARTLKRLAVHCTETVKKREEKDNITVEFIKILPDPEADHA